MNHIAQLICLRDAEQLVLNCIENKLKKTTKKQKEYAQLLTIAAFTRGRMSRISARLSLLLPYDSSGIGIVQGEDDVPGDLASFMGALLYRYDCAAETMSDVSSAFVCEVNGAELQQDVEHYRLKETGS